MFSRRPAITLLILSILASPLLAVPPNNPDLFKAYFLEHESRDFAAARKLYQSALRSGSPEDKRAARAGADRCRDQLAAQNFATLMPPDATMYFELSRPGEIIEKLCGMLGLTTDDMQAILAQRPSAEAKSPFHIPSQVAISPSLFEYFRGFGGAGVALTSFDPEQGAPPTGVMVIHHGDVALMKGLLETAFQFAPTGEKIGDLPTFSFECPEMGKVSGVLTECLLVVGTGRELVEGAVARLTGDAPSLASRDDLKDVMNQRAGATLFAFADLQRVLKTVQQKMSERDRREFDVANAVGDLDSLRWATFSLGIHEGQLGIQFAVRLADDHRSIAYNLMRLPPMGRRCLECVPASAAGIVGLGLNPALVNAAVDTAQRGAKQGVTGFDIGREFFGNIQELCAFVVPGEAKESDDSRHGHIIPNAGVILAVNDAARSNALWDQLLSIPGMVGGKEPVAPQKAKIGETDVTAYAIPNFGKIYMTELNGCVAIATTRSALKSCIQAGAKKKSIINDEVMGPVLAKLPKDSSIMIAAHAGRLAEVGAAIHQDAASTMAASQAKQICSKTVFWAGLGQSPNQMTLRLSLAGLPDVNEVLKNYGPMINSFASMAMQQAQHGKDVKVAKKQAKKIKAAPREDEPEADRGELP